MCLAHEPANSIHCERRMGEPGSALQELVLLTGRQPGALTPIGRPGKCRREERTGCCEQPGGAPLQGRKLFPEEVTPVVGLKGPGSQLRMG